MPLMGVSEVRDSVETGLNDYALQTVINGIEEEVEQRFGAVAAQTDDLLGGGSSVWTSRPVATITTVTETIGNTDTVLAANDYVLRHNSQLDRLDTGTNARQAWGDRVKIVYINRGVAARRKLAYIKLIKLEIQYNGLSSESAGDYSSVSAQYLQERNRVFATLNEGIGFV